MHDRTTEFEAAVGVVFRLSKNALKNDLEPSTPPSSPLLSSPLPSSLPSSLLPPATLAGISTAKKSATAARLPPKSPLIPLTKALSQEIAAVRANVGRLYRLSSVKGLFQDPTSEINSLINTARNDMQNIDKAMRILMTEVAAQPGPLHELSKSGLRVAQEIASELGIDKVPDHAPSPSGLPPVFKLVASMRAPGRRSGAVWGFNTAWDMQLTRMVHHDLYDLKNRAQLEACARMSAAGDVRLHWTTVADSLKAHVLQVNKQLQEALRIRSENLKDQADQRRALARSTWAPVVAGGGTLVDAPLFRNDIGMVPAPPTNKLTPKPALPHPPVGSMLPTATEDGVKSAPAAFSYGANILKHRRAHNAIAANNGNGVTGGITQESNGDGGSHSYTAQQLARYKDATTRAAEARQVESTIVELGHMFNKMASMVAEQGEVVERIDADMTASVDNIQAGYNELNKFYKSIMSHRSFILKLFAVLLFVIALFTLVRR